MKFVLTLAVLMASSALASEPSFKPMHFRCLQPGFGGGFLNISLRVVSPTQIYFGPVGGSRDPYDLVSDCMKDLGYSPKMGTQVFSSQHEAIRLEERLLQAGSRGGTLWILGSPLRPDYICLRDEN